MSRCIHPPAVHERRGRDVHCGVCLRIVGRVALFPCAVLDQDEAALILEACRYEQPAHLDRDALAELSRAAGYPAGSYV